MKARLVLLLSLALSGCNEDTGNELVQFRAFAAGSERGLAEQGLEFDSAAGYHVRLDRAQLTLGAVYLNRSRPTLGAQSTACVSPGLYVAEVTSGVVIDALSPNPVEFGSTGQGISDRALTGEVWLTGGRIDALNDDTPILDLSGTATRDTAVFGFHGVVTIGENRNLGSSDPALPSANPLCKLRIVTPIPIDLTPTNGGTLTLRVAPEVWLDHVEFARLPGATGLDEDLEIPDSYENSAAIELFYGLRSLAAYRFEWSE
jgi:hypothetical protein